MLNIRNLASLKVLSRFLARKAKVEFRRAKEPKEPTKREDIMTESLLHTMIKEGKLGMCIYVKRGRIPDQTAQKVTWVNKQMGMMKLYAPDSNHCLVFHPGVVTLKARTTVMVLAKKAETVLIKTTPNVICWTMQAAVF